MPTNRRFLLQRRPDGTPVPDDFALVTEPTPALEEGQFLIRGDASDDVVNGFGCFGGARLTVEIAQVG